MSETVTRTLADEVAETERWAEFGRAAVRLADEFGLLPAAEAAKPRRRRGRPRKRRTADAVEATQNETGQEATN